MDSTVLTAIVTYNKPAPTTPISLKDQYCDIYKHACRKGVRRCYCPRHCGSHNICKEGICQKRQSTRYKECRLGSKACEYPPGYCRDYDAYCYDGYDDYCKVAYVCVDKEC